MTRSFRRKVQLPIAASTGAATVRTVARRRCETVINFKRPGSSSRDEPTGGENARGFLARVALVLRRGGRSAGSSVSPFLELEEPAWLLLEHVGQQSVLHTAYSVDRRKALISQRFLVRWATEWA